MAPDAPAVSFRRLAKRFGAVTALDGLDLDVPRGSVFGLLGPNGAGKTTAIRILVGLARPSSGEVRALGGTSDSSVVRDRLGYMPQEPRFYGWMRGRELLELLGRLHGLADRVAAARASDALVTAGLGDAAERRIGTYSGGMRQRLGIAAALVHEPELLVLDEPVSSLDPEGRRDVLALIERLRDRATVLLSTHVLADVERVCDRVAILDHGRLVLEGELEAILGGRSKAAFRVELEAAGVGARRSANGLAADGAADGAEGAAVRAHAAEGASLEALAAAIRSEPWARAVDLDRPAGSLTVSVADADRDGPELLALLAARRVPIGSVARVRPSLEDVFLDVVRPIGPEDLDGRGGRRRTSSTR